MRFLAVMGRCCLKCAKVTFSISDKDTARGRLWSMQNLLHGLLGHLSTSTYSCNKLGTFRCSKLKDVYPNAEPTKVESEKKVLKHSLDDTVRFQSPFIPIINIVYSGLKLGSSHLRTCLNCTTGSFVTHSQRRENGLTSVRA